LKESSQILQLAISLRFVSQIGGKKCWLLNFFVFVEKTKVNFVPRNCDE